MRNTAGGIATFAGVMFVLPGVAAILPNSWGDTIDPYLPLSAGTAILSIHQDPSSLAPWTGFLLFCGYALAAMAISAWLLVQTRRVEAPAPCIVRGGETMELGIYTFAELTPGEHAGTTVTPAQRLRDLMEEIELADQVGLDVFGVGEHHRPDFAVSAPAVVLAAAAERTRTIRLSSAVTVLSSDDPVRVFQEFATLDLLSGGRAEIMAGRGSFIESFPLFGYRLGDYDSLFAEKLELLLELRDIDPRDVVGPAPRAARRPRRVPASGAGAASDLGRRRRHARVGAARRHARPADGARHHRWHARALRALRRAPPARGGRGRPRRGRCAQHQLARVRRRRPRSRRRTSRSRRSRPR